MNKSSNKGDVDIDFYTKLYPSILEKGINTPRKILNYYTSTGKNKKHITNKKQLDNFIKSINFDWIFYKSILKLNDIHNEFDTIRHFFNSEDNSKFINKCDFLKKTDFDIIIYKNYNKDLIEFNNQQLINHFISYGYRENRIYSNKILNIKTSEKEYLELKKNYEEKINNFKKLDLELKKKKKKFILERENLKKEKKILLKEKEKLLKDKEEFLKDKDIYIEKNNNKICVFHCGNIDTFKLIIKTFPIIKKFYLIITYYDDLYKDKFKDCNFKKYKLLKVENKGMDCGPMLLSIKYLLNNKNLYNEHTIFYKIHTKSIPEWRDTLISEMLEFDNSILFMDIPYIFGSNKYIYSDNKGVNRIYIDKIVDRNENKDIYYFYDNYYDEFVSGNTENKFTDLLPSLEFYKNYEPDLGFVEDLEHWEIYGINEFHRKSNINYIKNYKKYTNFFIAGTIFGFNKKYLDLFKNYDLDFEYSILEEGYLNNITLKKIHAWEYFFGLLTLINDGIIIGVDQDKNNIYKKKICKPKIKYSVINIPFKKSDIAFFLIIPGDKPDSGGYRTILKYINFLNKSGYTIDIYFGICWNDEELYYNVDKINNDGMPICENWLDESDTEIIYKLIKNIEKYNIIDIKSNNFYLGLKCQRKYKVLIANAWQIADAVYKNIEYTESIYYIIQDREELFYPDNEELRNNVIKTYRKEYNYYCITQYLGNYFKKNYEYLSIQDSFMGVDLDIYKNLKYKRDNSVLIPYYGNLKPGRKPELVRKIIDILSRNNIRCYVFPYDFEKVNENIINLGIMNENELNELYNKHKVGIIFSNTNPSRLGFEMYASGMQVIEYDSEFTKYDMPSNFFKKINDKSKIINITNKLFNKEYNNEFLKNININKDYQNFLNYIKKNL